jgi:hypothetical protein
MGREGLRRQVSGLRKGTLPAAQIEALDKPRNPTRNFAVTLAAGMSGFGLPET